MRRVYWLVLALLIAMLLMFLTIEKSKAHLHGPGSQAYAFLVCLSKEPTVDIVKAAVDEQLYLTLVSLAINSGYCFRLDRNVGVILKEKVAEGKFFNGDAVEAWTLESEKEHKFFGLIHLKTAGRDL